MTRRLPFPQLAPECWSDAVRAAWESGVSREGWSACFVRRIGHAVSNYLGFSADRPLLESEEARVRAYADTLLTHLAPASAVAYVEQLMYGLQMLAPEADRAWLAALCREMRDRHIPRARKPRTVVSPGRYSLPVLEWPRELRERWLAAREPRGNRRYRDRKKSVGPAARDWSEAYANRVARGFGLYLRFAASEGLAAEPTPEAIDRFCEITAVRSSPVSLASYVWEVYRAASLLFPYADWDWLRGDAQFLENRAVPSRNKVAQLAQIAELRDLGWRLLRETEAKPVRVGSALDHRDALLLILLTYKPARVRNYAEAEYGKHVVITEAGGRLDFPETKNGDPDGHPLPPEVAQHILLHWHRFRPLLKQASACQSLFLSKMGAPLSSGAISRIIGDLTLDRLGKRVPPHLFRDSVATSIAEYGPEFVESASVLLGQRDPRSIETYQRHAETPMAARQLEAIVEQYRKPVRRG